eukprot:9246280-Pyramimonas_sp.AAC.1
MFKPRYSRVRVSESERFRPGAVRRRAERCMRLLHEFVMQGEGRVICGRPPHMSTFRGTSMPMTLCTAGRVPARLHLAAHEHEYLLTLRARAAQHLGCSTSQVRLLSVLPVSSRLRSVLFSMSSIEVPMFTMRPKAITSAAPPRRCACSRAAASCCTTRACSRSSASARGRWSPRR